MEINHSGIVAEQERYKYAVKANNKSNIIIFKFSKEQDSIILDPDKHFYVKVQNSGKTFTDKDPNVVVTSDANNVFISWTMLRKVTAYKNIDVQVQYEDADEDIVWQSAIVNIDLFQTIPADKEIEDKYPSILMAHQQKLDEFERRIKTLEDAPAPTHEWGQITGDIHNQTDLMEIINDINSAISSEATARINADTELNTKIETEKTDRETAISEESETRSEADAAEIIARENADSVLHQEIEAEKVARQNDVRGINAELGGKVDKVEGKALSTNDYTTEEKIKLNGIAADATKVVVLASTPNGYVVINGTETCVYDDTELREQIGGKTASWVIDSQSQITGDKDAYENYTNVTAIEGLALEFLKVGDNIYVRNNEQPDYWVDNKVVVEGQVILALRAFDTKTDLSQYPTKAEVAALLDNKVDKVAGSSLVPDTKVANYDNHIINKQNPHEVTKQQVGLGEVDNKSEATIKDDFTGVIEEGNEGFVKGGDVYEATKDSAKIIVTGATIEPTDDDIKNIFRKEVLHVGGSDVIGATIVEREYKAGGELTSNCNTTKNGTQIGNYGAFNGYFDKSLNELYGDNFTVSSFTNVYTAYYPNVDGNPVSAIRIGTKNAGEIILSNLPEGITKLKLIVGKYFSYNGSTGQKSYDENAVLQIGIPGEIEMGAQGFITFDYSLEEEPTELEIDLEELGYIGGEIALISYGSSSRGRVFLYGFIAEAAPTNVYTVKELAKKEDVEAVQEYITEEVEPRIDAAESNIAQNARDINDVNVDLQETKEKIGDVSIYDAEYLPRARSEFIKKILRVDGKLYQCIRHGEEKTYSFENVQGTSEVTANKWDAFASEVTSEFEDDFQLRDIPEWIPATSMRTDGTEYRTTDSFRDADAFCIVLDSGSYTVNSYKGTFVPDMGEVILPISEIDYIGNSILYSNFQIDNITDTINFFIEGDDRRIYFTCQDNTGFNEDALQYLEEHNLNHGPQISKFYRNNGNIKLGSSSAYGMFELEVASDKEPITKITLNVKSYNASKTSGYNSWVENEDGQISYSEELVLASEYAQDFVIYNKAVDSIENPKYIKINSDKSTESAQENRLLILSMTVTYGDPYYEWKEISGGGSGGTYKWIDIEVKKIITYDPESEDPDTPDELYCKKSLKVNLHNFDYTDVGEVLELEVYTRKSQKTRKLKRWVHPKDPVSNRVYPAWLNEIGYACTSNNNMPVQEWQPNEGFLRTEWMISNKNISDGYIEIDLSNLLLDMVNPDFYDEINHKWVVNKMHINPETESGYDYNNRIVSEDVNKYRFKINDIISKNSFKIRRLDAFYSTRVEAHCRAIDLNGDVFVNGHFFGIMFK